MATRHHLWNTAIPCIINGSSASSQNVPIYSSCYCLFFQRSVNAVEVSLASRLGGKNAAFQMAQDSNGYLWIGTQQGLYSYQTIEQLAFTEVDHPEFITLYARQIAILSDSIWFADQATIFGYNKANGSSIAKQFVSVTEDSETETLLTKLDDSTLVVSYANKLYTYSVTTDQFSPLLPQNADIEDNIFYIQVKQDYLLLVRMTKVSMPLHLPSQVINQANDKRVD